jgi:CDP-4-dehydro-6-deoxyglucose reductase, E1
MKNKKYPLSEDSWDDEEIKAIQKVLESRRYTMGETVKAYEKKFSRFFGSKYSVMVNSGSSANLIAIASMIYSGRLKHGDEVIVPAISWSTTYYPLYQYGLKIKFVDVDLKTLNLDLSHINKAIGKRTKAIFTVNLLGNPNDFKTLQEICHNKDVVLLEDNCEAMGARFNGRFTGTFGLIGTFSTFFSHHISTMEGGVAITNDEEIYHYLLALRAHGWTRNLPSDSKIYRKSEDDFYEMFNFILPGYNLRPLEIEAAVGVKQLDKLGRIIKIRRDNARYFCKRLSEFKDLSTQHEIGNSSWFGFPIILRNDLFGKRKQIIKQLKNKNIENRPIVAGNFVRNSVIKYLNYRIFGKLTNADYIHENGFFVGNHSTLIHDELDYLFDTLGGFDK